LKEKIGKEEKKANNIQMNLYENNLYDLPLKATMWG
jgi:hypothetical protein